jgi:dolichol-phosphate mannosyltransferase
VCTSCATTGIIGEYLGRLVQESKGRPLLLIDSISAGGGSHPLPLQFSQMPRSAQQHLLDLMSISAAADPSQLRSHSPAPRSQLI